MGERSFLAEKLGDYMQRGEAVWHAVYRDRTQGRLLEHEAAWGE